MFSALAAALGLCLVLGTVVVHYEGLRIIGYGIADRRIHPRVKVLVVILGCLAAHMLEILIYAFGLHVILMFPQLGSVEGIYDGSTTDLIYFAMTSYTTLGIGEVYPVGPVRLVVGLASINGLLLITWSASFTYLTMQRHWHPEER